jgi:hypothetical protein
MEKPLELGNKTSKANGSICLDLGLHAYGILIGFK